MTITDISRAKAQLSALIARVEAGEEVIIGRSGKPVAKLVPIDRPTRRRQPGALQGEITIGPDFDELPDDFRRPFGMRRL